MSMLLAALIPATLALTLTLAAAPAAADPQQIVITAPRTADAPRLDAVQQRCPGMADTLVRELTPALNQLGKQGTSQLVFRWQDNLAQDVAFQAGPLEYRGPIRRALRWLDCKAAPGERFALAIRFAPAD